MADQESKYATNDRILCFHGPILYEAKILDVTKEDSVWKYFVHYQGWKNRWDEWVTDERIMPHNEENLKKQRELETKHGSTGGGKVGGGGGQRGKSGPGGGTSTPKASKAQASGGKSKTTGGSAGASTPLDNASKSAVDTSGAGFELESRASTPSVDGSVSVASSATGNASVGHGGSVKRKGATKQRGAGSTGSAASTPAQKQEERSETPVGEPKRKRGRQSGPNSQNTTGLASTGTPAPGANGVIPELCVETYEQFRGRQEIAIKIPDDLKELMVDDWDLVTRQNKLCKIPSVKSVDAILEEYIKERQGQRKPNQVTETTNGIREYFNALCGTQLLYKFERPQFNQVLSKNQISDGKHNDGPNSVSKSDHRLSSVYGFPHLLRLFVRIGQMLAYTDLDQKSIDLILSWIQDFLKYLSKKKTSLFRMEDYETAPPEYIRLAYVN